MLQVGARRVVPQFVCEGALENLEKIAIPTQFANFFSQPGHPISFGRAQWTSFSRALGVNSSLTEPATSSHWMNPKPIGAINGSESLALSESNGLSLLLRCISAALLCHYDHSLLGRRLSDLHAEPEQPHEVHVGHEAPPT